MINAKLLEKEFSKIEREKITTIFWVTETQARAKRIMWLEKICAITRNQDSRRDAFPNMVYITNREHLTPVVADGGERAQNESGVSNPHRT